MKKGGGTAQKPTCKGCTKLHVVLALKLPCCDLHIFSLVVPISKAALHLTVTPSILPLLHLAPRERGERRSRCLRGWCLVQHLQMPLLSAETHSHWDVLEVTLSTETLRDVFCPRARTRRILFPEMFIPVDSDSLLHFSKAHVGVVMQEWSSQEKRKKKSNL